ncbi:MAG: hypothetical protein PHV34_21105 [Verrucomicrobiae bacterium]|nr:hypothetical protein [Verrucomicrobiae bacterium]
MPSAFLFALLLILAPHVARGQSPHVSMSFPIDDALCRATIPVFGSATVIGGKDADFKEWRLEYGEGRHPAKWNRIAGGDKPVKRDPWVRGEVVWNPNWGAHGNLADWNTGLVGYAYGEWQTNFNGIYTIRLTAELHNGRKAERRLTVIIGEAIILLNGGTTISVDGFCRYSVPPFSFDNQNGFVAAAVRVEPPGQEGKFPTAEMGEDARRIYETVAQGMPLLSAIYQLYPIGFAADPPCQLQIDLPAGGAPSSRSVICVYSPARKKWLPLRTQWAGRMAIARISRLPAPQAYYAIMSANMPPDEPRVEWEAATALTGFWKGEAEPGGKLRLNDGRCVREYELDEEGGFRIPFAVQPRTCVYEFSVARANGEVSKPARISQTPETRQPGPQANLRVVGKGELSGTDPLYVECEDPSVSKGRERVHVMGVVIQRDNLETVAVVELNQLAGDSPKFGGVIKAGSGAGEVQTEKLRHNENLSAVLANGNAARLVYRDAVPPVVSRLDSTTHPAVFWSNPGDPSTPQLAPLNEQSGVRITHEGNALRLAGTRRDTTRLVHWPVDGFSVDAGPVLTFDYRCSDPGPWQILLRRDIKTFVLPLGNGQQYFPVLFPTPPLTGDGKWHTFEVNLKQGGEIKLDRVDQVLMGSWLKSDIYLTVEPGFKSASSQVLQIKNLWIGRPSVETAAVMQWQVDDPSGVRKCEWWVDDDSDAESPAPNALKGEVANFSQTSIQKAGVRLNLPGAGRWFFHVLAEDNAGNRGKPVCFPLRVTPNALERRQSAVVAAISKADEETVWQQPDGKFSLKLPGLADSFDPSKTELMVDGEAFAAPKVTWDSMGETMTFDKQSFKRMAPLGGDGEIMAMDVSLADANGRRLPQRPAFKVTIHSPFVWRQEGDEFRLEWKESKCGGKWLARWASPSPPWAEWFPGAVNNVLLLSQPQTREAVKKKEPLLVWGKPVRIRPAGLKPVMWQETWQGPGVEMADEKTAAMLQNPNRPGNKTLHWVWRQDGGDSFEPDRVRVVYLAGETQFDQRVVSLAQAAELLNRQPPNSKIRLDGWLHPEHAPWFYLKIEGKRRLVFSSDVATSSRWVDARGEDVRLRAREDWTRFAVLIETNRRYAEQHGCGIHGGSYW